MSSCISRLKKGIHDQNTGWGPTPCTQFCISMARLCFSCLRAKELERWWRRRGAESRWSMHLPSYSCYFRGTGDAGRGWMKAAFDSKGSDFPGRRQGERREIYRLKERRLKHSTGKGRIRSCKRGRDPSEQREKNRGRDKGSMCQKMGGEVMCCFVVKYFLLRGRAQGFPLRWGAIKAKLLCTSPASSSRAHKALLRGTAPSSSSAIGAASISMAKWGHWDCHHGPPAPSSPVLSLPTPGFGLNHFPLGLGDAIQKSGSAAHFSVPWCWEAVFSLALRWQTPKRCRSVILNLQSEDWWGSTDYI